MVDNGTSNHNNGISASFSFLLAAEWDIVTARRSADFCTNRFDITLDERLNMRKAVELLLADGNWVPYPTAETTLSAMAEKNCERPLYGEYLYFNSHMRRLIYNQSKFDNNTKAYLKRLEDNNDDVVVLHRNSQGVEYILWRIWGNDKKEVKLIKYTIPMEDIELRIYSTGVMLLALRCYSSDDNKKYNKKTFTLPVSNLTNNIKPFMITGGNLEIDNKECQDKNVVESLTQDDYSWIESCGRRVFAARFVEDIGFFNEYPILSEIVETKIVKLLKNAGSSEKGESSEEYEQKKERFTICDYGESFRKIIEKEDNKPCPIVPEETICSAENLGFTTKLICGSCYSRTAYEQNFEAAGKKDCLVIACFNDDRMFVQGIITSGELSETIKSGWANRGTSEGKGKLAPWYGMLYADNNWNSPTYQDPEMRTQILEKQTIPRWCGYGSFYGMTYHSMITLVDSKSTSFLYTNNNWHYFQMFIIAIVQRSTVQRFYREAAGLLGRKYDSEEKHSRAVLKQYILFLNHYWFREVTEQEQGKEMFSMLQASMDIERDAEFLDTALDELHQQNQNKMESAVNKLLVPTAILGGVWAFSEMTQNMVACALSMDKNWIWPFVPAILFLVLISVLFVWYGRNQIAYLVQKIKDACQRSKKRHNYLPKNSRRKHGEKTEKR